MCQTHAQHKTLGRKNDLVRYFVSYGFSFIEKNPNSIVLLVFCIRFWTLKGQSVTTYVFEPL